MGSPIISIVANLYIEDFEIKVINSDEHPPNVWKRYVDDTFVVLRSADKYRYIEHINNIDPYIQFTVKDLRGDGPIPFLDIFVRPEPDKSLSTMVYRKLPPYSLIFAVRQSLQPGC